MLARTQKASQTPPMTARAQFASQDVLQCVVRPARTQISFQHALKHHNTTRTQKSSLHPKCISTCIVYTPTMPARTQIASQHVLTKQSNSSEDKKFVSTYVDHNHLMIANTQNASQHVMTILILRQLEHESMCWPNPLHASEDIKCISTCVNQTHPMPANPHKIYLNMCWPTPPPIKTRTQNASQLVLTKHHQCHRGHEIHISMCWPNPSNAIEDTKFTSTCVGHHIPCQWAHKTYLNLCWPNTPMLSLTENHRNIWWINPSNASEDTKCISTWVDQIHPMPARTQNVSLLVLTNDSKFTTRVKINFMFTLAYEGLVNQCWNAFYVFPGIGWVSSTQVGIYILCPGNGCQGLDASLSFPGMGGVFLKAFYVLPGVAWVWSTQVCL